MSDTFYFIAHPCGDKSKVTVIDLSHAVSYERRDWDAINSVDFTCHKEAITYAKGIADKYNLQYELFDSRYDESLNEGLELDVENEQEKPIVSSPVEAVVMCGCGRPTRYSHGSLDVMSCNKYAVCLTYEEQEDLIKKLSSEKAKYGAALEKIVNVNAMDYEYKAWAKQALDV